MQQLADQLIAMAIRDIPSLLQIPFIIGFHAVPSMSRLHCHVISSDLISTGLRTKTHYNSFTTRFFVPLEVVLLELTTVGKFNVPHDKVNQLLKLDLKCHKCKRGMKNMPTLKGHLEVCAAVLNRPA